jgi:hypothetical protein
LKAQQRKDVRYFGCARSRNRTANYFASPGALRADLGLGRRDAQSFAWNDVARPSTEEERSRDRGDQAIDGRRAFLDAGGSAIHARGAFR